MWGKDQYPVTILGYKYDINLIKQKSINDLKNQFTIMT